MLQKIGKALRIPVANIKGIITTQNLFNVGMQMIEFGALMPLAAPKSIYTEIRHDFEKNEIGQGIVIIIGGILTTGCIAYGKYLQMIPSKKTNQANSEILPLIINNNIINDDGKAKETQNNSKSSEILHILVGIAYIPSDILLQITAINKFFYRKYKITLPLYAYIPGTMSLLIQDIRLLAQTTGTDNRLGQYLEYFKNTKLGLLSEANAVLHRFLAAKFSFEQLSASNPYLNYLYYQTYNILSIVPRWTNNITQNNDNDSTQTSRQSALGFFFAFSYAIEDAALYIYALPELSQLGPGAQLAFVGVLTLAEAPVYSEKANIASKWLTQKASSYASSIHAFFTEKSKLPNQDNSVINGEYSDIPSTQNEIVLPNGFNY